MKRHLSVVPDQPSSSTTVERWPRGTVTQMMDVLGRASSYGTPVKLCDALLEAIEPQVRMREKNAVNVLLDRLETTVAGPLTMSQRGVVAWLRKETQK